MMMKQLLGFAHSFDTGKDISFSEKHNAAALSFTQILFQAN